MCWKEWASWMDKVNLMVMAKSKGKGYKKRLVAEKRLEKMQEKGKLQASRMVTSRVSLELMGLRLTALDYFGLE